MFKIFHYSSKHFPHLLNENYQNLQHYRASQSECDKQLLVWINLNFYKHRGDHLECPFNNWSVTIITSDAKNLMNEMKAFDHLPTHLGRGVLHTFLPPPKQESLLDPSNRYPGKQENVRESPTPKWNPILLLKAGTPGSSQGSRSYSVQSKTITLFKSTIESANIFNQFIYIFIQIQASKNKWKTLLNICHMDI